MAAASLPREAGTRALVDTTTSLDRARRSAAPELMDRPDCDPDRLERALDGLARVHALTGGHALHTRPLARAADRAADRDELLILDVGAGGGEGSAHLRRRLRQAGRGSRAVLCDLHPVTIQLARERRRRDRGVDPEGYRYLRLTASRLPFPDGCFDLAFSATTLHHLERDEAVRFLAEIDRVSAGRWVVTDLRRSLLAWSLVRLLAATVWRNNPFPRRDGPLSVRRSYTPDELEGLLAEAGLSGARVDRRGPVRLRALGAGLT